MKQDVMTWAMVLGLAVGCATDDASEVRQEVGGGLVARPDVIDLGGVRVGETASGASTLQNTSGTDVVIERITIAPPSPGGEPCRPELIVPCLRPGEATRMTVACTFAEPGAIELRAVVAYSDGSNAYELVVPVIATAR